MDCAWRVTARLLAAWEILAAGMGKQKEGIRIDHSKLLGLGLPGVTILVICEMLTWRVGEGALALQEVYSIHCLPSSLAIVFFSSSVLSIICFIHLHSLHFASLVYYFQRFF